MAYFKGWRYAAFISGFVGFIGLTLYPIIISPMLDPSHYKEIQKETRKNINREQIQPGNMKVWTDPFDRKKPETNG
ncbi:small integral membrane protein 20 [Galleria mellonella]|uniref:Small integral membrane protein 20 n=1 Tax=Galleria mellonella TaxID=7137 RepID=A0A6J1WDN0_GALME|nr:small integral membrane protein 20 [Galleria mellonella]